VDHDPRDDWRTEEALLRAQVRLGAASPPPWQPPADRTLVAVGCFVAFARGEQGPGARGDRAWCAAALVAETGELLAGVVVPGRAGASYKPGMLALREGSLLLDALEVLDGRPDVLLVDATGRDHPRRAGLALHLGAVVDLPSIGVTHRPLLAVGAEPREPDAGASAPLHIDGEEVARWVRTRSGVKPVVAHAAWQTDVDTAVEVVLRTTASARSPEPLRQARRLAREARSSASSS
jgi:deoxyribonuclease V